MKKIISALFISLFVISMTACDQNSSSSDAEQMTEAESSSSDSMESGAMGSKVSSEQAQNAWANFGSTPSEETAEEDSGNQ